MTATIEAAESPKRVDWRRIAFLSLGVVIFLGVFFSPAWPDAEDPKGNVYPLHEKGKIALGIFLLAGVWWVFEVVPIGVTSLMIAVLQAVFLVRIIPEIGLDNQKAIFTDFMSPSVMFIFASIVIGLVFTRTGLTQRLAYRILIIVGDRTSMILLGCFIVVAFLTHFMAHTAVAATIYPLLVAIYGMYDPSGKPSKFGKALFIGMAYVAGAGSIVTLLGAARGAVALGFYKKVVGVDVGFFEVTWYLFPVGWAMVFILWGFFMLVLKPERDRIPGVRERARELLERLGPMKWSEILTTLIVLSMIIILMGGAIFGWEINKTAVLLSTTVLFFVFGILGPKDLENGPWNIILLFGGAMSIGFCLWETKAADWMAVQCLSYISGAHALIFLLVLSTFVMLMTNFIMNVAAIAISLPVALKIAMTPSVNVAPELVLFSSLVVSGMPFLLLVGAAPNAIAYDSKQFTSGEFFKYGVPASIILIVVTMLAVWLLWPHMGMPVEAIPVGPPTVPAGP